MAERRMFTKKITDDDHFMELSSAAQALYLHLSMGADDDGFCNQVTIAMFRAHASVSDLQSLLDKRYIYQFENGVIVIKHWRMANALRKDRYTPTTFQEELHQLGIKENGAYTLTDPERLPSGCQVVAERLPQDSIGKDSIDKDSLGEVSTVQDSADKGKRKRFTPPTREEVAEYCELRGNKVDPDHWYDYYEANGWKVGKNSMKDWKASVRTWERNGYDRKQTTQDRIGWIAGIDWSDTEEGV